MTIVNLKDNWYRITEKRSHLAYIFLQFHQNSSAILLWEEPTGGFIMMSGNERHGSMDLPRNDSKRSIILYFNNLECITSTISYCLHAMPLPINTTPQIFGNFYRLYIEIKRLSIFIYHSQMFLHYVLQLINEYRSTSYIYM